MPPEFGWKLTESGFTFAKSMTSQGIQVFVYFEVKEPLWMESGLCGSEWHV